MLKSKNRLLAFFMSLVMMVSLFVTPSFAAVAEQGLGLEAVEADEAELLERSDIAFTVYTQIGKATRSVAKAYTKAELERLSETDSVGYFQKKGDALRVKAATQYVVLEDLITDALGDDAGYWAEGAKLEVACSDMDPYTKGPWKGGMSYETFHSAYQWFPNLTAEADDVTGAVDAPIILALAYGTGDVTTTAEAARGEALQAAYAGGLGILVGTTQAGLADKDSTCAGNRFPSNVNSVTVVVPEEKVAFRVYKQVGSEEKELIASYTKEELSDRASTDSVGYFQKKGNALKVKAATQYIVLEDLINEALGSESDLWAAGAKLEVACSDMDPYTKGPWKDGMSYETFHSAYQWFPNLTAEADDVTGAADAPIILALVYGTGDITTTAEAARGEALQAAYAGGLGILVGTTQAGLADKDSTCAGNRFPSNVVSMTVVVPEKNNAFTVYVKDADGEVTEAAAYTKKELENFAMTDSVGYLQKKGDALRVKAATQYVVLEDLIVDALGDSAGYWAEGAKLEVACSDGIYKKGPWKDGMSYETFHSAYQWFPNLTAEADDVTGATDAPIILALAYGTGDVTTTAEAARGEALQAAYAGGLGILVGTTQAGLADKDSTCAGNRFPSNVVSVTVTLASKAMSYDISYELNGATVKNKMAFITVKEYQDMIVLPSANDMSYAGYEFGGWYRDAEFTKPFEDGTIGLSDRGDVTCYAKWYQVPGGSGGGGSVVVTSGTTPIANTTNAVIMGSPEAPLSGADWKKNTDGTWNYAAAKNAWAFITNPYATAGKAASGWFFFDANGKMLTGWQWIKGSDGVYRCYYLNPVSDGTLGMAYTNCTTPDGYTVDASGAWIKDGKVQTK